MLVSYIIAMGEAELLLTLRWLLDVDENYT